MGPPRRRWWWDPRPPWRLDFSLVASASVLSGEALPRLRCVVVRLSPAICSVFDCSEMVRGFCFYMDESASAASATGFTIFISTVRSKSNASNYIWGYTIIIQCKSWKSTLFVKNSDPVQYIIHDCLSVYNEILIVCCNNRSNFSFF